MQAYSSSSGLHESGAMIKGPYDEDLSATAGRKAS